MQIFKEFTFKKKWSEKNPFPFWISEVKYMLYWVHIGFACLLNPSAHASPHLLLCSFGQHNPRVSSSGFTEAAGGAEQQGCQPVRYPHRQQLVLTCCLKRWKDLGKYLSFLALGGVVPKGHLISFHAWILFFSNVLQLLEAGIERACWKDLSPKHSAIQIVVSGEERPHWFHKHLSSSDELLQSYRMPKDTNNPSDLIALRATSILFKSCSFQG